VADKGRQSSTAEEQDASFDALLRQMAQVSRPAPRAQAQFSVGATLSGGRFQILRRIGEGGMGLVYEARDEQRRDRVALKTLARLDAANIYRLKNEFRSLAHVSHRNLVHLHELFGESGESEHWFFTMELVDGERFDDWVRPASNLDETRLRAALPQLCEGIAAIHAAGKLHRDLKPSNVLVTRDGRVVVLDFGLAVDPELGGIGHTLRDESVSGTPAYMAPEQAAGLPATAASDFYAVGVMLFEALTGKLPFEGRTHDMLVDKQRRDAPSASEARLHVSRDLAVLCDALLARDPDARPDHESLRTALGTPRAMAPMPVHRRVVPDRDVLLGRERELAELGDAYEASRAGKPIVMLVSGESGIGKSALCHTFLDELRAQGHAVVLAGRCHERESVPFKGMDSLVDDLSRFLHKLSHADASALMPREVYALARIFPALGRIEAVAQAPKKDIVDPQELRLRAFAAFCELLTRVRDRRPLVLYIDDAQWLDRDAVTFLGYLLAQHEVAALLLMSHRSEEAAVNPSLVELERELRERTHWQRRDLSLRGLQPTAARALATRLLGTQHSAQAPEVAAESNGSPFFVATLSRHMQRWNGNGSPTLQEALFAQLQALGSSARQLLEVLAVAGRPLPLPVALDAARASYEQVDALHREHLLRRNGSGQELGIECYHDKIRESVALTLSVERLQALHGSLLAALTAVSNTDAEHLALHAQGAGEPAIAARYAAQAGLRASEALAFDQAALFYARALELGSHAEHEQRELRTKLGEALANAGRGADAARAYIEASQGAAEEHALELKRRAAEQLLISGHIEAGRAQLGEVLRAIGLRLPRGTTAAKLALAWEGERLRLRGLAFRERQGALPAAQRRELDVLFSAVRGLQAVDVFSGAALCTRYLRRALALGLPDHAARAFAHQTWFARAAESVADSDALLDRGEALALASGRTETIACISFVRGMTAYTRGDQRACKELCDRAAAVLRERCTGVAFELGRAHQFGMLAGGYLGDFAPAAQIAALIDEAWRRGDLYAGTSYIAFGVLGRLMQGDGEGVRRHIEQARRHWPRPRDYTWPDWYLLFANTWHALYSGEYRRSLEHLQADWPAFERAGFVRIPSVHTAFRLYRGASALAVARLGGEDAAKLRALASDETRVLGKLRAPFARPFARLLEALSALDVGRREQAIGHLRDALPAFEAVGMLAFAVAVRRRLGQLLGAEEGAACVAQAERAARAMGVVDVEAMTRLLMFGF
jgi:hypothetical protein